MSNHDQQARFNQLVQRANEMLGCPGRLVVFDWRMEQLMRDDAVFGARCGLEGQHAIEVFEQSRRGHSTFTGLERWQVRVDGKVFPVIKLHDGFGQVLSDPSFDVWIVPVSHYKTLYRHLREIHRDDGEELALPPIMRDADKARLWENSIGFLLRGDELLKRYGVPQKRGLLLVGEPGNGKTMACRWLYHETTRRRINWRCVTADQYDMARAHGSTGNLFSIAAPGIILFDDLDLGMRDRNETGPSREHSVLLAELDGVEQREGVVYLFTTNMKLNQLDPAFIRRGRIDQIIHFPKPDGQLRRQMILEFWHSDITDAIDLKQVVKDTDGRSFADLAELKKLLVLSYLDSGKWDWPAAWNNFQLSDEPDRPRRSIGFAQRYRDHDEFDEDYDPLFDPMRAEDD